MADSNSTAAASALNFTVHAYDRSDHLFVSNLVQFEFTLHTDLPAMVAHACRVELSQSSHEIELTNPPANTVLVNLKASVRSRYGVENMCQLFLSSNLWRRRDLFHVQFSKTHNQSYVSVDRFTGSVRLERVFYGKLRFQFRSGLFFKVWFFFAVVLIFFFGWNIFLNFLYFNWLGLFFSGLIQFNLAMKGFLIARKVYCNLN